MSRKLERTVEVVCRKLRGGTNTPSSGIPRKRGMETRKEPDARSTRGGDTYTHASFGRTNSDTSRIICHCNLQADSAGQRNHTCKITPRRIASGNYSSMFHPSRRVMATAKKTAWRQSFILSIVAHQVGELRRINVPFKTNSDCKFISYIYQWSLSIDLFLEFCTIFFILL